MIISNLTNLEFLGTCVIVIQRSKSGKLIAISHRIHLFLTVFTEKSRAAGTVASSQITTLLISHESASDTVIDLQLPARQLNYQNSLHFFEAGLGECSSIH